MLSLDATQLGLVASAYKKVSWLFKVVDSAGPTTYRWGTVARSYGGNTYTFKILPDSINLTLNRNRSELGVYAPNTLEFSIHNSGNTLTASNFEDGSVEVYFVLSDGTDEETIFTLRFVIQQCSGVYEELHFSCIDFLAPYLKGDYPNTKLVKDISPSDDPDPTETLCVPVPFGTCYIPLRSIYITDQRYYLLGPTAGGLTYSISKVHSPRQTGTKSEWDSGSYSFTQSTKTIDSVSWRVFQPIIADSDGDDVADACGLWMDGETFLDMPTKFSRSDTSSMTSPADIIEFVLEDMGVPSAEIDTGGGSTFEAAETTYSGWGLTFIGAFWQKKSREQVLASLLNMCHSCLRVTDKVELHVLSKTSQKTVTDADVIRTSEIGKGTFSYTPAFSEQQSDSGNIEFQDTGVPQDAFHKHSVPADAGGSKDDISSEVLTIPFVQDSQDAQRIGTLYYQRKLLKKGNANFTSKNTLVALQPDDVITVNDALYGGSYALLVDNMRVKHDCSIDFGCIRFSCTMDDWGDFTPSVISPASDDSTNVWHPGWTGPAGDTPNLVVIYYQASEPSGDIDTGDFWIDSDDNMLYRYNGSAWVEVQDDDIATAITNAATAQATADGKVYVWRQTSAPTADAVGDLWLDSDDGDRMYRWNGSAWIDVQDDDIATAISNAATAQATADGKVTTFYAASAPTAEGVGDLWVDTDDDRIYRWNGSSWVDIQDNDIATALARAFDSDDAAAMIQGVFAQDTVSNLVINGGFEQVDGSGDAYWWESGTGISTETSGGDNSNYYLKVTRSGTDNNPSHVEPSGGVRYMEVNPGELYELGGSGKSDGSCTWRIRVYEVDKDKSWVQTRELTGTETSWTLKSTQFTTESTTKFLRVLVGAVTTNGWAAFDNVYLRQVGPVDDNLKVIYYQASAPGSGMDTGDYWIDSDDNMIYRWNGSSWAEIQDDDIADAITAAATAQSTADGKVYVWRQTSAPTADAVGDIWLDSDDGDKMYRWNGSAWQDVQDDDIYDALTDAATAQATADGKIVSFYQTSAPTADGVGDIWFDTDDNNKPYRWNGSAWVSAEYDAADWAKIFGSGIPDDNADVTEDNPQDLDWIDGTGGTLTISSSGKISITAADALEITASGGIKVLAGGDIYMVSDTSDPAIIVFEGATVDSYIGSVNTNNIVCWWPDTSGSGSLYFGYETASLTETPFSTFRVLTETQIKMQSTDSGDATCYGYVNVYSDGSYAQADLMAQDSAQYGQVRAYSDGTSPNATLHAQYDSNNFAIIKAYATSSTGQITFYVVDGGTGRSISMTDTHFYPQTDSVIDLGGDSYRWHYFYCDDGYATNSFHNGADFFHLDDRDDLAAILAIQGSGQYDSITGLEIIDDSTLAPWILSKHPADGQEEDSEGNVMNTWKAGDIVYDKRNRPYLSHRMTTSLTWGALRQIDARLKALEEQTP